MASSIVKGQNMQQFECTQNATRHELKKSIEELDKKLKDLQDELSSTNEQILKEKATQPNQLISPSNKPQSITSINSNKYSNSKDFGKKDTPKNSQGLLLQSNITDNFSKNQNLSNISITNGVHHPILNFSDNKVKTSSSNDNLIDGGKSSLDTEEPQDETLETIRMKLKKIFKFYATFGDRGSAAYLKSNKFHKLINDAGLRDNNLTQKKLDLLFVAENQHKSNMDFEQFLSLLQKISLIKYRQNYNETECLELLLKEYLLPLYHDIYDKSAIGADENKLHEPLDEEVIFVLMHVHQKFFKMFQTFFPCEIVKNQAIFIVKQKSEHALFSFLREFDICPTLIAKNHAFALWNDIIDTPTGNLSNNPNIPNIIPFAEKDIGTVLKYSKFCTFLIRSAMIAYDNQIEPRDRNYTNAEKFVLLLEKMELSNGMKNFEMKFNNTHNSKSSLLLPKDALQKVFFTDTKALTSPSNNSIGTNQSSANKKNSNVFISPRNNSISKNKMNRSELAMRDLSMSENKIWAHELTDKDYSFRTSRMGNNGKNDQTTRSGSKNALGPVEYKIFEEYLDRLHKIFQYYCSFGEPLNKTKLKSIKFIKLLKECGLLQNINNISARLDNETTRLFDKAATNRELELNKSYSKRLISQIDADIIFVKLTGSKQMKEALLDNIVYDKNVKSPTLGFTNHLLRNRACLSDPNASLGKLEFDAFLKAIEMIAFKMFPEYDIDHSIKVIIENYILTLENVIANMPNEQMNLDGQPLKILVEILQDPEMVEFLGLVHKSFQTYYRFYCDSKSLMNFQKFMNFCKDFCIFPDVLTKAKITNFFFTLSSIYTNNLKFQKLNEYNTQEKENLQTSNNSILKKIPTSPSTSNLAIRKAIDQPEDELIDQHLFIEAIALCALEVQYSEPLPSNIERIIFLLERMNQSEGPLIVQKASGHTRDLSGGSWDILSEIRKKYAHVFIKAQQTIVKATFDDLLRSKFDRIQNQLPT